MWSNLPFDLLANVFSFLSPDSLARAKTACRHWYTCANVYPLATRPQHTVWFVALPTRSHGPCCYVHNPVLNSWHELSHMLLSDPVRPITSVGSLILLRLTNSVVLQLAICNPFAREVRLLPLLNTARTNPAVGVVVLGSSRHSPFPQFRVYAAGGMSEAPHGGAKYESTLEMYDSVTEIWQIVGPVPVEFAVRLTVWTPNENIYSNGVLYWMTSARAYSVMGFEVRSNKWHELSVPMADRLEFAALAQREGRLTLVGGTSGSDACVWELNDEHIWCLIAKVPTELGSKLLEGKASWGDTKCVGGDGAICLYRDLRCGIIVWRGNGHEGKWEWLWVEGCRSLQSKQVQNMSIKGVLIHPNLSPSSTILHK